MKVTKELFNRLNKKDQEEYKLRIKEARNKIEVLPITLDITYSFIKIFAFLIIIIPLYKLAFGMDTVIPLFKVFLTTARIFTFAIALGIYLDLLLNILYPLMLINRIKREYFNVEIKVRKR